jgi:hypothetical protein
MPRKTKDMADLSRGRLSYKKLLVFMSAFLLASLHFSNIYGIEISFKHDTCTMSTPSFAESLADHLDGKLLENDRTGDGKTWSSVIWIPTYYGYHSFLGVLDAFIAAHTALTSLRTWRLADRNFYVIQLWQNNLSVRIIYDSRNSILMLTTPAGY